MFESSSDLRIPQWVLDGWDSPDVFDDVEDPLGVVCDCPVHVHASGEMDVPAFLRDGHVPDVLGLVPAVDIVRWLSSEPPSPRVVELTHALTAMTELERRAAGWPAWLAPDLLSVWARINSWVASRTDAAIVSVAGMSRRGFDDWGQEEVALALRLAPVTGGVRLQLARERRGPLTRVGAALADGTLLATQADDLVRELQELDGVTVDEVCDRVLPAAGEWTRAELVKATRTAVISADPEGAAQRHEKAKQDRGVCIVNLPDAMTDVTFRVIATEALRIRAALDDYVRQHADSGRSADQLRADALVAWAMGQLASATRSTAHGRLLTEARVTMTAGAFLGDTDEPAILDGYGPIHAQLARDLITADTRVRRLLTAPFTGTLVAMDPTIYRASQFCADVVITRDATCRLPGCNRAAALCDLDHRDKFTDHGPTCPCNLSPLCRRHHRMKDAGGWQLLRRDDRLRWITPTGREYNVTPHSTDPTEIPSPWAICGPTACTIHTRRAAAPPPPPPPPELTAPPPEEPCPF